MMTMKKEKKNGTSERTRVALSFFYDDRSPLYSAMVIITHHQQMLRKSNSGGDVGNRCV